MDKIIIKNLTTECIIGVNGWERENTQKIYINLTIYVDTKKAGENDDLSMSINYFTLASKVKLHAEKAKRLTVEALAEDIAKLCLEEEKALKVKVSVDKPDIIKFVDSVGVKITRTKEDYQDSD